MRARLAQVPPWLCSCDSKAPDDLQIALRGRCVTLAILGSATPFSSLDAPRTEELANLAMLPPTRGDTICLMKFAPWIRNSPPS